MNDFRNSDETDKYDIFYLIFLGIGLIAFLFFGDPDAMDSIINHYIK